jgi:4-amino-4-deoxy-L-arabinose transferase-like glycosyltransferase
VVRAPASFVVVTSAATRGLASAGRVTAGRTSANAGRVFGARLGAVPGVALCVTAVVPIAIFIWIALHRVGYRFELDWMEGGSVELAARVAAGHSIYAAPSLAFVGWPYTPLYYWLAAGVAHITGTGFLPLRLVSLAASLGVMSALAWIVVRETGQRAAGLAAAGLYAATFRISGAWFDTGRVDSLFLALTLVAIGWGRRAQNARGGVLLGVLAFLAFFTKQTALVALLPALIYLVITNRRVGVCAVAVLSALVLASTVVMNVSSHGWYGYYVFSELTHQPWSSRAWVGFWITDLLGQQWPLIVLIAGRALLGPGFRGRRVWRVRVSYYAAAATGLLVAAWLSRLHTGGYANVLMPAYAAMALLAGLAYGQLGKPAARRAAGAALVLVQLVLLAYPISAQIPTAADTAAGAQLLARLRALPGPVLVVRHPWYATLVGKGTFAQEEAIGDVMRSSAPRGARILDAELPISLDAFRVQAVVLDGTFDARFFSAELAHEFRLLPQPITTRPLYPLTDVRTAPTLIYVRRAH